MKKIVILIAFISALSTTSFAQTASLNIILADILSFSVTQPAALTVNFNTEAKYTNGITAVATDHVSVTSSCGFIVRVVAGSVTGSANLAPGSVKITSSIGSTNTGNTSGITYASGVTLPASGSTPATIITLKIVPGAAPAPLTNLTFHTLSVQTELMQVSLQVLT